MSRKHAPFVMEFIGTLFLVLIIGLATSSNTGPGALAPICIGFGLLALVFAGGHISGAQYNPAVTIGVWLRGDQFSGVEAIIFVVVQVVGGFCGALLAYLICNTTTMPAPGPGISFGSAFLAEALFTFFLVFVILNVATASTQDHNDFFGMAIGFTVGSSAFAIGGVSGAMLNPAVATGLLLMSQFHTGTGLVHLVLYWTACPLGGILASLVFRFLTNASEYDPAPRGFDDEHDPMVPKRTSTQMSGMGAHFSGSHAGNRVNH